MPEAQCPTYWAILVGINHYQSGPGRNRPLRGAVQDIEDIEGMLQSYIKGKNLEIIKIVADKPDSKAFKSLSQGSPNYETVVGKAFERVKFEAKPGDFFYFHFSGHGSRKRRKMVTGDESGGLRYEMLVLDGDRHLPDYVLGGILDGLASRDIATFVVLDCCHSGGADRSDEDNEGVRGIDDLDADSEDEDDLLSPSNRTLSRFDSTVDGLHTSRDVSTEDSYWLGLKEYTLLAACYPGEKAIEIPDQGRHRGLLTKEVMHALSRLASMGGELTYRALYEKVRLGMMKETKGRGQHCMLHGKADRFLFGRQSVENQRICTVREVIKDKSNGTVVVWLDRGEVHGVCSGEEYAIHQLGVAVVPTGCRSADGLPRVKIERVEATQAYATRIEAEGIIEVGCMAELVRPVLRRPLHVKIQDPDLLAAMRELLLDEGPGPFNPILSSMEESPDSAYRVRTVGSNYQIADSGGNPLRHCLPVSGSDKEEAAMTVCTRLRRLARFFFALELTNKCSTLDNKFSFTVTPSGILDNESVKLTYTNHSDQNLFFTLLSLTVRCQVKIIGTEGPVEPSGTYSATKRLLIPDEMEVNELEDVLMVIVTTEQTGFESLESPGLHVDDEAGRGDGDEDDDEFEELEDILGFGTRDVADPGSSWQTHQVIVKVKKRVE